MGAVRKHIAIMVMIMIIITMYAVENYYLLYNLNEYKLSHNINKVLYVYLDVYKNGKRIIHSSGDPILSDYFTGVLEGCHGCAINDIYLSSNNVEICFVASNIHYSIGLSLNVLDNSKAFCLSAKVKYIDYGNGTVDVVVFTSGSPPSSSQVYGAYIKISYTLNYLSCGAITENHAVAYENFGSPISLSADDIITVVYRFRFQLGAGG